jgi:hypothetical protein
MKRGFPLFSNLCLTSKANKMKQQCGVVRKNLSTASEPLCNHELNLSVSSREVAKPDVIKIQNEFKFCLSVKAH